MHRLVSRNRLNFNWDNSALLKTAGQHAKLTTTHSAQYSVAIFLTFPSNHVHVICKKDRGKSWNYVSFSVLLHSVIPKVISKNKCCHQLQYLSVLNSCLKCFKCCSIKSFSLERVERAIIGENRILTISNNLSSICV